MDDNFFDLAGARADVIAALQASAAAHPTGSLLAAKQFVIAQLQASTVAWAACSLRYSFIEGLAATSCNYSTHASAAAAHGVPA